MKFINGERYEGECFIYFYCILTFCIFFCEPKENGAITGESDMELIIIKMEIGILI